MEKIEYKPMDAKTQQILDSVKSHHYYIKEYICPYSNYIWIDFDNVYKVIDTPSNFIYTNKYIIYLDRNDKEFMIRNKIMQ